ncbi:MAG: hypothetical protein AAF565_09945 [Pseudomonadota bacterium]
MTAFRIDTLKFARSLKEAGADEKLAEAIASGLNDADVSELTTKSDLLDLELRIAEKFETLYRQLWIMAAGIVGLTVTLIKFLP